MLKAAGILFHTKTGRALYLKRGAGGDWPGYWCFPGGKTEEGETAEETALREAKEEVGQVPDGVRTVWTRRVAIDPVAIPGVPDQSAQGVSTAEDIAQPTEVDFTTFTQQVDAEFLPTINGEHVGYAWAPLDQPPEPLHPGCRVALARFTMDELAVAKAIVAGDLVSPQQFRNVKLYAMRITGTGFAYRPQLNEFAYRRPENYLTADFLERCNGLPLIMLHPAKAVLDSKEFSQRIVGIMVCPFIKGDEVWGIAKVYDDAAISLLDSDAMSTSPGVVLSSGSKKMTLEDGATLLLESKAGLLDHLAICERGVWDKGGDPAGVESVTAQDAAIAPAKAAGNTIATAYDDELAGVYLAFTRVKNKLCSMS